MTENYILPTDYQQFIYLSRYARWLDDKKRREYWDESVKRYLTFFKDRFKNRNIPTEIWDELYDAILHLEILPSMRGIWTAGPALAKDESAIFNCAFQIIDSLRAFSEVLYNLMVRSWRSDSQLKDNS